MNVLGICPYGAHRSKGMSSLLSSMSVHNIRSIATLSVVRGVLLPESVPFVATGIFVLSPPLAFYRFAGRSMDIGPLSHFYCICIVLFLIAGGGHRVHS
jgi:hypothetical protein